MQGLFEDQLIETSFKDPHQLFLEEPDRAINFDKF